MRNKATKMYSFTIKVTGTNLDDIHFAIEKAQDEIVTGNLEGGDEGKEYSYKYTETSK